MNAPRRRRDPRSTTIVTCPRDSLTKPFDEVATSAVSSTASRPRSFADLDLDADRCRLRIGVGGAGDGGEGRTPLVAQGGHRRQLAAVVGEVGVQLRTGDVARGPDAIGHAQPVVDR